jgi:hypothetical protein
VATEDKADDSVQVYCFLDAMRVCGPDCAAFVVAPLAAPTGTLAVPDRCEIVQALRHLKHLPILNMRVEALVAKVK